LLERLDQRHFYRARYAVAHGNGAEAAVGRAAQLRLPLTALDPAQGTNFSTVISLIHPKEIQFYRM
jgi:hypothetical protein